MRQQFRMRFGDSRDNNRDGRRDKNRLEDKLQRGGLRRSGGNR